MLLEAERIFMFTTLSAAFRPYIKGIPGASLIEREKS
jgi:hypothetical protein